MPKYASDNVTSLKKREPSSHLDGRVDEVLALLSVRDVADGPDRSDPLGLEPLHRLVDVFLQQVRPKKQKPDQKRSGGVQQEEVTTAGKLGRTCLREEMTTAAPSRPRRSAMARPIPCVDAVTTATFPSSRWHLTSIGSRASISPVLSLRCWLLGRKRALFLFRFSLDFCVARRWKQDRFDQSAAGRMTKPAAKIVLSSLFGFLKIVRLNLKNYKKNLRY
jgi:hypothetical protein